MHIVKGWLAILFFTLGMGITDHQDTNRNGWGFLLLQNDLIV